MHSSNVLRPTKPQLAITNGEYRGRSRPSVDESKLARDRTRTREYAVVAARGGDHDLEQALFQSVAAVARVSDHEQRFASLEVMRCRPREQLHRQRLRQARQYGGGFGSPAFHDFSPRKAPSKLSHNL